MFFGKKIVKILKVKSGQDAIIEIDNILSKIFYSNPDKLTNSEKNIVYIEELEREINNGGFNQYFFNSSGNYATETINALKLIVSKIFLQLLEEAVG
jgi:adenosylmethionine-8-amino-7-oxononanoate aminotransferase